MYEDAINSPQSQKLTVGSIVERYVNEATNNTAAAIILFILLNFFNSILLYTKFILLKTTKIVPLQQISCNNKLIMANNDWKSRLGMVYSTNPDFQFEQEEVYEEETLAPKDQKLVVAIDKKGRGGKQVTVVNGFVGKEDDLVDLGKALKTKCGVGGSVKEGQILIQGDQRDKIVAILTGLGYKAKRGN